VKSKGKFSRAVLLMARRDGKLMISTNWAISQILAMKSDVPQEIYDFAIGLADKMKTKGFTVGPGTAKQESIDASVCVLGRLLASCAWSDVSHRNVAACRFTHLRRSPAALTKHLSRRIAFLCRSGSRALLMV